MAKEGGMDGKGACVVGGVHGRGHAWQRTCMEGCAWQRGVNGGGCAWQGVCGKGTCMAEGHAWQGHAWQGACVAGGHVWQGGICGRGEGACIVGACMAGSMHGGVGCACRRDGH